MTNLPGIAAQIEEAIGLELTVELLKKRGGTEITIPVKPKGTVLAELVGVEAAEKIIREIGPGKILLPCGQMRGAGARREQALQMLRNGASLQTVALKCDIHVRTVSNYRAELEAEQAERDQLKLPFDKP